MVKINWTQKRQQQLDSAERKPTGLTEIGLARKENHNSRHRGKQTKKSKPTKWIANLDFKSSRSLAQQTFRTRVGHIFCGRQWCGASVSLCVKNVRKGMEITALESQTGNTFALTCVAVSFEQYQKEKFEAPLSQSDTLQQKLYSY